MMDVKQIKTLLPLQGPAALQAQMEAGHDAVQRASAPSAPYSSRLAGLAKALEGGLGGMMEGSAQRQMMQAQQAATAGAYGWLNAMQPGQGGGAPSSAGAPAPAPIGQGGIGSDHVASPGDGSTRDAAIRTIYGEAGGESAQGQAGVAAVLKNRLASGQFGKDMQSVIFAPKQFSLWNPGNAAGDTARRLSPDSPAYQRIGQIYDGVMSGAIPDPTGGATHYYNPRNASPDWGPKLAAQNDVTIGNHRFVGAGPGGPNGGAVARADMPAPNAQPVSSNTLPPDITPDMIGPGQRGVPPNALVGSGNALHRGDEMPAGTPPYVPGQASHPLTEATSTQSALRADRAERMLETLRLRDPSEADLQASAMLMAGLRMLQEVRGTPKVLDMLARLGPALVEECSASPSASEPSPSAAPAPAEPTPAEPVQPVDRIGLMLAYLRALPRGEGLAEPTSQVPENRPQNRR